MADDTNTGAPTWLSASCDEPHVADRLGLVIVWSLAEPSRVGELAFLEQGGRTIFGRGDTPDAPEERRLRFGIERPGMPWTAGPPLRAEGISRRQLALTARGSSLEVERIGKIGVLIDDRRVERAHVTPGEIISIEGQLLLLCVRRPAASFGGSAPGFPFGGPDAFGIIGESPAAWRLRDAIAFYARGEDNVLVHGPSGSGKELAARALHGLSSRASGPFVARNAATLPESLVDAELFGSAKNYPNAGMRERAGLFGEAEGGVLFLDEIGELPDSVQSHLLRVLDSGEYHRLGDERGRRADVRVVAATNRAPSTLKHDLLARFTSRLTVPALSDRVEDIPFLIRDIVGALATRDPVLRARFFDGEHPRIHPDLVSALVRHELAANVREIASLVMLAIAGSRDDFVAMTREVTALVLPRAAQLEDRGPTYSRQDIEAALARAGGNVSRAWQELGVSSRDALNRLMKRHGITPPRQRAK